MTVTRQTIKLEIGDVVKLSMPDGSTIDVGFGGVGFGGPDRRPWVITFANNNERGFEMQPDATLTEYPLDNL